MPKCFDPDRPDWHEDFLLIASVTKLGRIFRREQVSTSLRADGRNTLSLLAAVFLDEFERLSRVPIREYRRSTWTNPNLEGELDYTEVWEARPDGFLQTGPILSANNEFMAVIVEAASYLGHASADRGTGQRLLRLASTFPNTVRGRTRDRVPGRYARWQYLYDLASAVTSVSGCNLDPAARCLHPASP